MAQTTTTVQPESKPQFKWIPTDIFVVAGLVLLVVGAWGMWQRLAFGLLPTSLTSYVPWGFWVAFYDYLVWLEIGSLLVFTILVYLVGDKVLERIKPVVLLTGLVVLLMALLLVLLDLGRPMRFWHVYLYPDFSSMITWMIWLHTIYLVVLLAKLLLALGVLIRDEIKRHRIEYLLAYLTLPMGLALIIVSGSVFGVVSARPLWNTSSLPLMFLLSTLAAGSGLLTLLTVIFWQDKMTGEYRQIVRRLARLTGWFLVAGVFSAAVIGFTILYQGSTSRAESFLLILTGPFWWSFWIIHLLLGVAIPVLILFTKADQPGWVGFASALSVVTFFAVTLNVVIPVLATPELKGLVGAFVDQKLVFNYVPSTAEWLLTAFILGLGGILYGLGMRWSPIRQKLGS